MNPERKSGHEEISGLTIPVVALEGIGGSGKSHIGDIVAQKLRKQGFEILVSKVSGLGDSDKVRRLRVINEAREKSLNDGTASQKVIKDKRKDKIFRLATRYQARLFLKDLRSTNADVAVIDRTPLMSWVYAVSADPQNPYLNEILEDSLKTTSELGLSRVYFLKVFPETAYSRLIARTCAGDLEPEKKSREICSLIGAPKESEDKIVDMAMKLIRENPNIKLKSFRSWDYIPFEVMCRECKNYLKIFGELKRNNGIKLVTIDAEKSIDEVVSGMESDLRDFISKESQGS